jgi:hypothetical protein
MAKIKADIIRLQGKMGDKIITTSNKHGDTARQAPREGIKKDEAELKRQYSRTQFLNQLASELNSVIKIYTANKFKSTDFYSRVQSRFRAEPLDNRFLLLNKIVSLEVNNAYRSDPGSEIYKIDTDENNIVVSLRVESHPPGRKFKFDCYCYEMVLLTWNKTNKPATHTSQHSEWIFTNESKPDFEFTFPKNKTTKHWLLCIRKRLGNQSKFIDTRASESMYIADAGTFDKEEQAILDQRVKEEELRKAAKPKEVVDNVVRVKAIRRRD